MKKIVLTIGSMRGGGAERVMSILCNSLCNYYEITLIALFDNEIVYDLDSRVNYIYLDHSQGSNRIVKQIIRLKQLRKTIDEIKPDVIVSFLTVINILTLISNLGKKYPIIVSERNDPRNETPNFWMRIIRNILYYSSKKIYFVFQTPYARSQFKKEIEKRTNIIYNPIKQNLPEPYIGIREKRIVSVARLEVAKNHRLLLEAFSIFDSFYSGYTLELFGIGPLRIELEEYAFDLGISNKVIFKGFSKNVHEEIISAKMFVLTSDYEGISNAMLESLAIGIPTITTDCPAYGGRLFIDSGVNGFLTPVGNVELLVKKMIAIAENEKLQKSFSKNSIKIKELLKEETIVQKWKNFIEEILNE